MELREACIAKSAFRQGQNSWMYMFVAIVYTTKTPTAKKSIIQNIPELYRELAM